MAGAGYRLFNTGDVLTAAQVNTYLQQQVIMVFASSAARTTALSGVLAEGMFSYLTDTNAFQYYDGAAWTDVSNPGDITAVTAGTGLTGGGTSGAVSLATDLTIPVGWSTTATAAGTTTLTAASNSTQFFTGSTTQTIVLPVASTMVLGEAYIIHNNSTGALTVNSSGSNLVATIPAGNTWVITCILTSGTTAASWDADFTGTSLVTGTGSNVLDTNPTITSPLINLGINANTSTTYTFVLADNGKLVTSNNASAQTLSIPTNASVAFPVGTQINVAWITGAGQPTIQAVTSGTTTVLSTGATSTAPKLRVVNSVASCVKIATDTWLVTGDVA